MEMLFLDKSLVRRALRAFRQKASLTQNCTSRRQTPATEGTHILQSFVVRAEDLRVQFGPAREIEPNRAM
jgi:hypothetical protein